MKISYELKKTLLIKKKTEEAIITDVYNNLSISGMPVLIFPFSYDPQTFTFRGC